MPADPGGQTRSALEGMKKSLEEAGATLDDVVERTRFVTDLFDQDAMNEAWGGYVTGSKPTTVTVQVVKPATDPRCMVEISAIAVVNNEA